MQTHQLKRNHPNMKRMIVARGGKRGKTAGRGGKGQSARAGNKRRPEWRDIIKKIPKLRGRGVNQHKPVSDRPVVVNLAMISGAFSAGDAVTPTTLVEKGLISTWSGRIPAVKILGDGELAKALKVSGCTVSESAKAGIEKAGGSITPVPSRVVPKVSAPKAPKAPKVPKEAAPSEKKEVKAEKPVKADPASPASSAKATEVKKATQGNEKPVKVEKKEAKPKAQKKAAK